MNFITDFDEKITLSEVVDFHNKLHFQNKIQKICLQKIKFLMTYLISEKKLLKIFENMKGIYLLMRGDIASEFILNLDLDFGLQNLHKVMKHQIYYALDLALRKTVVSSNFFFE